MQGTDTRSVGSFVKTLSRTERQVVMLHYAERLNLAEIAAVLDLGEAAITEMLESIRGRARLALVGAAGPT